MTLWGDKDVIRYTAIPAPCSPEQIVSRIECLSVYDVFVLRLEGEMIGVVGCICMDDIGAEYALFYHLKRAYWGKGYAACAVEQLLKKKREKVPSAVFYSDVVSGNIASEKILQHFRFECVSVEKNGFEREGVRMDIKHYKL